MLVVLLHGCLGFFVLFIVVIMFSLWVSNGDWEDRLRNDPYYVEQNIKPYTTYLSFPSNSIWQHLSYGLVRSKREYSH